MHAYSILNEQFHKIHSVQHQGIQHCLLKGSHLQRKGFIQLVPGFKGQPLDATVTLAWGGFGVLTEFP